jgi:hypothetical protein
MALLILPLSGDRPEGNRQDRSLVSFVEGDLWRRLDQSNHHQFELGAESSRWSFGVEDLRGHLAYWSDADKETADRLNGVYPIPGRQS